MRCQARIRAVEPNERQRAIVGVFARESNWQKLMAAWAERAYTLRELAGALHRCGHARSPAARYFERMGDHRTERTVSGDWRSAAGHAPTSRVRATPRRLPRLPRRRAGDDRFHLAAGWLPGTPYAPPPAAGAPTTGAASMDARNE